MSLSRPGARALLCVLVFGCAETQDVAHLGPLGTLSGSVAEAKAPIEEDLGPVRAPELPAAAAKSSAVRDPCPRSTARFAQPVVLEEDLELPRYPPLVGFPMPFARSAQVRGTGGFFAASEKGTPLPTQFEALARYDGAPADCAHPIRWGYAHVLAQVKPSSRAYLALLHTPKVDPEPAAALSASEDETALYIDTGVARFTVRRAPFVGLSRVELHDGKKLRTVTEIGPEAGFLVRSGKKLARPGTPESIEFEQRGPIVATIAVKGHYRFDDEHTSYRYTIRLRFVAGTGSVFVDHTHYNGAVQGIGQNDAQNLVESDQVALELPLAAGSGSLRLSARAHKKLHAPLAAADFALTQHKRGPNRLTPLYSLRSGKRDLETGLFAERPFLAVLSDQAQVIAVLERLAFRDPQALRFVAKDRRLVIAFQSERVALGGAKGIWSRALLDFDRPGPGVEGRASAMLAQLERPLIAVPDVAYVNQTKVMPPLPAKDLPARYKKFDDDVDEIHDRTTAYLRSTPITGTQVWPDLPKTSCEVDGNCAAERTRYFDDGASNYWDWAKVEYEEFLRTADPAFLHDFALGEARLFAETISFRPDRAILPKVTFAGFAPCYGSSRGWQDKYVEGLNYRRDTCNGQYSYNRLVKWAYVLTADRRFTDFFADGAEGAINFFGVRPAKKTVKYRELASGRGTFQALEMLLNAAEFSPVTEDAERYGAQSQRYFDFLTENAMAGGHACGMSETASSDPKQLGRCDSEQAWMMPPYLEWVGRLHSIYDYAPAAKWIADWVRTSAKNHTVLDSRGFPDLDEDRAQDSDNARNGWRTVYNCAADPRGIIEPSCIKNTRIEASGYFYTNGLIAYLNAFGLALGLNPATAPQICPWLPDAYAKVLSRIDPGSLNGMTWGKSSGQAYAFSQAALGALELCKP